MNVNEIIYFSRGFVHSKRAGCTEKLLTSIQEIELANPTNKRRCTA